MNALKNFYNQYVKREDRLFFYLLLASSLLGLTYIFVNVLTHQYSGGSYLPIEWSLMAPLFLGLTLLALYARKQSPRMGFLTWTYGLYFFMMMALTAIYYGVQYSPFPVIDPWLVKADTFMGFNSIALLNWTYAHHAVLKILKFCYDAIGPELAVLPMLLALLMQKKSVKVYFLALFIATIVGATIYYFFPTTAPASMFFNAHFVAAQQDTFIKFFEIHHHLPLTTSLGGMVAFPSFHVIWAALLIYAFKDKKLLLYPIAIFNMLIIASTVFLGWHYLTDVIGGLVLAGLSIALAEFIYKKYIASDKTSQKKPSLSRKTAHWYFSKTAANHGVFPRQHIFRE